MLRYRRLLVLLATIAVCVSGLFAASPARAATVSQPPVGALGGEGPCTKGTTLSKPNQEPGGAGQTVWVFTPTGTGAPRSGGRCDDNHRPVAFVVHGFGGVIPLAYQGLIDNMVSNGHIVVFANYSFAWAPDVTYPNVIAGMVQAAGPMNASLGNRMDLSNIGIWGHSSGAGMVPWLAQQAEAKGWGRHGMWLSMNAMYFAFKVGVNGPIHVPSNARVQVIAYDQDTSADQGIGIDAYNSFDIPQSQKTSIQITHDPGTVADHFVPVSWIGLPLPVNNLDWYGVYRNYQVLSDCAITGNDCGADVTFMGLRSNGQEAIRATVSEHPVDSGAATHDDCRYFANWRTYGVPHLCAPFSQS